MAQLAPPQCKDGSTAQKHNNFVLKSTLDCLKWEQQADKPMLGLKSIAFSCIRSLLDTAQSITSE